MRADIRPGGIFPDYALPGHTGTVQTLSQSIALASKRQPAADIVAELTPLAP